MPFCGKCGKEVRTGVKFCPHCGAQMKSAGVQPPPSIVQTPLPSQTRTQKLKNILFKRKLIAIPIIVIVSFIGFYFYAHWSFKNTVTDILSTIEFVDFRIEDLSIFPPSATLVMICSVENPGNNPVTISMDFSYYIENEYIASITADNEKIQPHGTSMIELQLSLGSTAIDKFVSIDFENARMTLSGTITAESKVFFFPVKTVEQFEKILQ